MANPATGGQLFLPSLSAVKCGARLNSRFIVVASDSRGRGGGRLVRHLAEGVSGWCSRRRRHATSAILEIGEPSYELGGDMFGLTMPRSETSNQKTNKTQILPTQKLKDRFDRFLFFNRGIIKLKTSILDLQLHRQYQL